MNNFIKALTLREIAKHEANAAEEINQLLETEYESVADLKNDLAECAKGHLARAESYMAQARQEIND